MLSWPDRALLALLIVDGFVVGVLSVAFAYLRFGGVALPVAALAAGLLNAVLLWLAAGYTDGPLRWGPMIAWLVALVGGSLPGPGGDVLLLPDGGLLLPTVLLIVLGAGIPAALSWSGRLSPPR